MDDLTPKQRAFVIAYRTSGNATEAARTAGYSGNDVTLASVGHENLKKPQIIQALRTLEISDKPKIADANEVLEILTSVMRGAIVATHQQVRAAELLGKRYRLFDEDGQGPERFTWPEDAP
jgi:phage terminase small subunit